MTMLYEIAPARDGWVLKHEGEVLAEYESEAWAIRVAKVLLDRGRRAGHSIQVGLVERDGRARILARS